MTMCTQPADPRMMGMFGGPCQGCFETPRAWTHVVRGPDGERPLLDVVEDIIGDGDVVEERGRGVYAAAADLDGARQGLDGVARDLQAHMHRTRFEPPSARLRAGRVAKYTSACSAQRTAPPSAGNQIAVRCRQAGGCGEKVAFHRHVSTNAATQDQYRFLQRAQHGSRQRVCRLQAS